MPADRLLNTVLQLYRNVHDDHKTNQIVGSTTNLLTTLSNPLNLGVLTSQLLIAPAIWHRRDGLRTSLRIISIYNTAALRVRDHELDPTTHQGQRQSGGLTSEVWARAVAKGADDRSHRWQHLLVLTGVLMGMEGNDRRSLSNGLRSTLEQAVVTAANLAMETATTEGPMATGSIVLALNYAFPLLSETHRSLINYDALLPLAVQAMVAEEGFENGDFLAAINNDIQDVGPQIHWAPTSPSYAMLQALESKPIMAGMGPLSRLAAFAVEQATNPAVVLAAHTALMDFSSRVRHQWQATWLSSIDSLDESMRYTTEASQVTAPALWQTFKKMLYATVTTLQAIVARSLLDPSLRSREVAPELATRTLRTLRDLFFIGSRDNNSSFQVYSFTYLTSLDNLVRYPEAAVAFLAGIKPTSPNAVRSHSLYHPVHRSLDLFYLNVAEHLPLNIPTEACDELIVQPATTYLTHTGPPTSLSLEIFESAHSAILSALACPHNGPMTVKVVPFYVDTLFASFPSHISTRQFRVAFKTIMQIVSPPYPISATDPYLSETLLEMVRFRALSAGVDPLPPTPDALAQAADSENQPPQPHSEQSSLVVTLIDALPFLPLPLVEEWMTVTARTMAEVADPAMRKLVRERFVEVLVSGELDVERAAIGVAWWGTKGGRELVIGRSAPPAMMSGALVEEERASKL
ncbi:hypothetical protein VDGE_06440 [Verticillium dahliae]|uniref:Peroxin 8 n=1 Tax=Verticillium dahliae TaxID=27337 RepID=A0A444S2F8_VERDA|nr:hypothetical protein VDGE_06440 [Verticillium dahliae]